MFDFWKLKTAKRDVKKLFTKDQLDEIMKKSYKLKEEKPELSIIECVSIVLNSMNIFNVETK